MKRAASFLLSAVLWLESASLAAGTPTAAPSPNPAASGRFARGHVLALTRDYIVFTTGDALRLDPQTSIPKGTGLGSYVRVALDPLTSRVHAIELEPGAPAADDVEVAQLAPRFGANAHAASAGPNGGAIAQTGVATVTINVRVPSSTQPTDDVYLATDRSSFSPFEVRMTRVDAQRFTVALSVQAGSVLHYEFTRGTFTTLERTRVGGLVTPRTLNAIDGARTEDTVARWSDTL